MFPHDFFAAAYFAPTYFPPVEEEPIPGVGGGGPGAHRHRKLPDDLPDDEMAAMITVLLDA